MTCDMIKVQYTSQEREFDSLEEAAQFLSRLGQRPSLDGEEISIEYLDDEHGPLHSETWLCLQDYGDSEFKISPWADTGDFDRDCFFLDITDEEEIEDALEHFSSRGLRSNLRRDRMVPFPIRTTEDELILVAVKVQDFPVGALLFDGKALHRVTQVTRTKDGMVFLSFEGEFSVEGENKTMSRGRGARVPLVAGVRNALLVGLLHYEG
tara:strand:+ start:20642 stop:21268 length:627 start_codon:yes stop_codon:yes gene_type:complete